MKRQEAIVQAAGAIARTKATIERDIPGFVINQQEASPHALAEAALDSILHTLGEPDEEMIRAGVVAYDCKDTRRLPATAEEHCARISKAMLSTLTRPTDQAAL
jgi:hypothetical protein